MNVLDVAMADAHAVAVRDRGEHLMHQVSGVRLIEPAVRLLGEAIVQLAAAAVLLHQVDAPVIVKHLVQLDDERVVKLWQCSKRRTTRTV